MQGDEEDMNANGLQTMFSSEKQTWTTPDFWKSVLHARFNFDFDPCPKNPTFDGLSIEWGQRNFVNPPYNEIKRWVEKGYAEFKKGKLVVFFIPSRTDTSWWHDIIMKATEIEYIRGRVRFGDGKNSAPFPSAIVIFDPIRGDLPSISVKSSGEWGNMGVLA